MDVAAWLQGLGLERYVPAFRDNEIDWEVLPKLTSEDLKEIGVAAIGHRRKLLDAIAALGAAVPATAVTAAAPDAPAPADAERRQLTIMFCDLVGSTALSARSDPEDLREVIGAYHRCVAETVARFGGFVAKYMGDGVLVYFGYPQTHEEDAERAVFAGLAVIQSIALLALPQRLQVRVGIASGIVVVGDLIGEGSAQERGVVGETTNLAARLQGLAEPGTLVIADGTRRQLGSLFEIEDLRPQPLAGFAEPQHAWRVIGESGEVSRFEALRSSGTPLVGRDEELDLLLRRWQQAKTGEGRVVLITGEPGIGKSRLTAALNECIESQTHTRLRYFCSPHHQHTPLHPIIAQLERAAGFARDDSADDRLGKLAALLAPGASSAGEIALFAELLSLPNSAADLNLNPQRKLEKLFEALLRQLDALAQRRPVLAVFEDVHWIDPTSRQLLDLMIDRVRRLPVLLIVSFRPEFQPSWGDQPHVTTMALTRLGERDGELLVARLAGVGVLAAEIVDEIVARTDGVPLFVEELTKAVLESADQENRAVALLAASPTVRSAIPATLHAALIARLDHLGPAVREVAQIGAVLGREFTYELIQQVAPGSELDWALGRLSDAGLLFCRGVPPESSYLFKHALVQDAAYGTLLRGRRQELHARVAAVLRQFFADLVQRQPELLAAHLTVAGDAEQAIGYWLQAGERAKGRSADREAAAHLRAALRAAEQLSDRDARAAWELRILIALGPTLMVTHSSSAPEVLAVYDRARRLATETGRSVELFRALWGSWLASFSAGDMASAAALNDELRSLAGQHGGDELVLQAHHASWTTALLQGDLRAARRSIEAGLPLYRHDAHGHHALLYGGHDPGVCGHGVGGMILAFMGQLDRARSEAIAAISLARSLSHQGSLGHAYQFGCEAHYLRRDAAALGDIASEMLPAAAEHGSALAVANARIVHGWVLIADGRLAEGVGSVRDGLSGWRRTGSKFFAPYRLSRVADALVLAGEIDEALAILQEAAALAAETGEHWSDIVIDWLLGTALLRRAGIAADRLRAEEHLRQAIAAANETGALLIELRAATGLARAWEEQGRRAEARELLAPIYGCFTEGFDTPDLKNAKTLLGALR